MHKIQILGTGCAKCENLAKAATAAADELGIDYELEKVTDLLKFADFGVMVTPAMVVDGKVVVTGKVPGPEQLRELLPHE
jgi:small redox-active disulfide protein 2